MKDSGSVWFGNIPINWEMKRLKYVFHIQKDIAGEEGHTVLSITQAAFMASDTHMADELIRKRERSLKGAARAKLSRTKEFDHSKWVGGGMLDYRFSNARRIVNDIYSGEVSADV